MTTTGMKISAGAGIALLIAGFLIFVVSALGLLNAYFGQILPLVSGIGLVAFGVGVAVLAQSVVGDTPTRVLFWVGSAGWFLLGVQTLLGAFGMVAPLGTIAALATLGAAAGAVLLLARHQVQKPAGVALLVAMLAASLIFLGQHLLGLPFGVSMMLGVIAGVASVVAGILLLASGDKREIAGRRVVADDAPYNTLAVVAFVLAFVVSIASLVCGHLALRDIDRRGERGRGLAIAALVIGYVNLAASLIAGIVAAILYSGALR